MNEILFLRDLPPAPSKGGGALGQRSVQIKSRIFMTHYLRGLLPASAAAEVGVFTPFFIQIRVICSFLIFEKIYLFKVNHHSFTPSFGGGHGEVLI